MKPRRQNAIEVENLTKRYRLGVFDLNLRQSLADGAGRLARAVTGERPRAEASGREYWALKGVSFTVGDGEIIGIIGKNGAGKSTLLKILARVTEPTGGQVRFRGRVGSMLEVGTGFHPELSGRDNIFLNGAILGMTHREILRKYDEIVDFSGVETFIDTPVKRYSSGMYMRLAFAVAAHLESHILLVDEVLAVGDAEFQKKCLRRMADLAQDGRTIVFVSHNVAAVQALCRRCLLLEGGRLVAEGATPEVLGHYLRRNSEDAAARTWPPHDAPGNGLVTLKAIRIISDVGPGTPIDVTTPFRIVTDYERTAEPGASMINLLLYTGAGVLVFDTANPARLEAPGCYREECPVPGDLLNTGPYTLSVRLHGHDEPMELPNVLAFEILDSGRDRGGWLGAWNGVLRPRFAWSTSRLTR
jgi:lipopolysaccharide transport system ATP-binding protein